MVKNLPANAGDIRDMGSILLAWEDSQEEEMATHSSILAMDRGAWQATVHGVIRVGHDLATKQPPPSVVLSTFTLLHKRF